MFIRIYFVGTMMSPMHSVEKLVDTCFATIPRSKPDIVKANPIKLVAHRGAHDKTLNIIENTDAAFARAITLGCWGIEFDVHASLDQTLLINHDPHLKRLWRQHITIANTPFSTIHAAAPLIPTLDEVVATYGKRMHLFIEIKTPFIAIDALVASLKPLTPIDDYHLLTLDEHQLPSLKRFPNKAILLVPTYKNVNRFCKLSLNEQYGGVLGHYVLMRDKYISRLTAANQLTGVGFVESKYSLYRELKRNLNFIFSNNAGYIVDCINHLQRPHL